MIKLIYKKSGKRINLHVEIQIESKIDFQSLLEKYLGLIPDLSNKLIRNDNQGLYMLLI